MSSQQQGNPGNPLSSHNNSTSPTSGSSPPNHDTPSSGLKRRRTSTSTPRGVANLNPDQLAKKRANDREAQRAIRERTKQQIESLERRIQELTAQKPYQDLQEVIRQKEAVEAENADIKRRLSAVLSIIQQLIGNKGDETQSPACNERSLPPTRLPFPTNSTSHTTPSVSPADTTTSQTTWVNPATLTPSVSSSTTFVCGDSLDRAHNSNLIPIRPYDPAERHHLSYFLDSPSDSHNTKPQPSPQRRSGPPLPANSHITLRTFDSKSPLPPSASPSHPSTPNGALIPPHAVLPLNTPPTCVLDGLLLDFRTKCSAMVRAGQPPASIAGPSYPSFSHYFYPARTPYADPISRFLTAILRTFPNINNPPEQVATVYIMFLVIRWLVAPSHTTYEQLPEWLRPVRAQLEVPHPAWVDLIAWPRMREKVIAAGPDRYPFDQIFVPFTMTMSLNWDGGLETLLVENTSQEGALGLSPAFERHFGVLGNWSLGRAFEREYSALCEGVRIRDEDVEGAKEGVGDLGA